MPGKAGDARPPDRGSAPAFHRAGRDAVEKALRRLGRRGRTEFPTQAAFLGAMRRELARADPTLRVGARRLRRLLVDAGDVRLRVTFSERLDRRPLVACPVCGDRLRSVVNQTLDGDTVVLGHACRRCGYWTHLRRRVPIRYSVRLTAGPATPRSSG